MLRDDADLLERLANEAAARIETALGRRAIAVRRRTPWPTCRRPWPAGSCGRLLARIDPEQFHGFDHVEQVLALTQSRRRPRMAADLPGVRVERNARKCCLIQERAWERPGAPTFQYELPVPGRVEIPGGRLHD